MSRCIEGQDRQQVTLADNSGEKVRKGSALIEKAGETMVQIVGGVQRVSGLIEEISSATREQADGISQVDTAITQLDQTTQQNAALVEEPAAAADSLQQQAVVCCSLEAISEWVGSEWPINHVHDPGKKSGGFLAPVKQVAPHWT